jgi:hypothetical protein
MPKSKNESWHDCVTPETPLQRGVFIDKCTEWLVKESANESEGAKVFPMEHRTRRTEERATSVPPLTLIGLTRTEVRLQHLKPCAFCDEKDGSKALVANPFSQKDLILVCDNCLEKG